MKKLMTMIILFALVTFSFSDENRTIYPKFDPVHVTQMTDQEAKDYELEMTLLNGKIVPKTAEELRLCKHYSEKGRSYKEYNKGRTDVMYDATVRNCERRIKMYCGYLQEVTLEENRASKQ